MMPHIWLILDWAISESIDPIIKDWGIGCLHQEPSWSIMTKIIMKKMVLKLSPSIGAIINLKHHEEEAIGDEALNRLLLIGAIHSIDILIQYWMTHWESQSRSHTIQWGVGFNSISVNRLSDSIHQIEDESDISNMESDMISDGTLNWIDWGIIDNWFIPESINWVSDPINWMILSPHNMSDQASNQYWVLMMSLLALNEPLGDPIVMIQYWSQIWVWMIHWVIEVHPHRIDDTSFHHIDIPIEWGEYLSPPS